LATKPEFAAFITEQLGGAARGVTCRKMFGEYGLHCHGKFFALLCSDTLYFKPTRSGVTLLAARDLLFPAPPYPGASDYDRIDCPDDREFLQALLEATVEELPFPQPKQAPRRKPRLKG
jgi:hypothetical protein